MPLLHLSLAFLCGVLLSAWLIAPVSWWLSLAGGCLLLTLLPPLVRRIRLRRSNFLVFNSHFATRISLFASRLSSFAARISPLPLTLLLAVLFFGAARFAATRFTLTNSDLAFHNDHAGTRILDGVVAGPPELRDTYVLVELDAKQVWEAEKAGGGKPGWSPVGAPQSVTGRLLAKLPLGDWRYGDQLRLTGRMTTPFETEDFSYLDYLAHRGIHSTFYCPSPPDERCATVLASGGGSAFYSWVYALRERLAAVIFRLFPDPEASLLAGILLGVEGTIPAAVRQAFNNTGTSHVIAISGFNFATIAGLFSAAFSRLLGRWKGMVAAFLGIALYAVLAGASAGVIRAALMGGLSVFAAQVGRRSNGLNSLAFVGALMAVHDPHVLWDVSFQLSFMATLGLILYADPLDGWFRTLAARRLPVPLVERLAGPFGEYFLFTLAAQLTTLPLILYYFRRLSLASLIVNPLILPAQPPVMLLGGLAALLGLLPGPLAAWAGGLAWPFVVYTIRVVEALDRLPGGAWTLGRFDPAWLIGFYLLLFGWTAFGARISNWVSAHWGAAPRLAWIVLLALLLGNTLAWRATLAAPDGRLSVTMLNVGDGDAFLVRTPSGRSLLIDGGPSPSALSDALGRRLPLGSEQIDYWIVAAAGDEQLTALEPAVERFPPTSVLWSGPQDASYSARRLQAALSATHIPVQTLQAGHVLDLGQGARLEVVAVTPKGAVLLLEWCSFRLLLPVGQDFESLEALSGGLKPAPLTALFLTAGGHAALNPPEWIALWQPRLALLSVAAGNAQGLPAPQVLESLSGYTLLRTDRNGWVELSTDGEKLWVEVERK